MVDAAPLAEGFEWADVPDDSTLDALLWLLGAHAVPVWSWGQRQAYEELVMAGPGLDQWVRTAGLWAESERMAWEWEQLVRHLTDREPEEVAAALGPLAGETAAASATWLDLMIRAASLDALGEHLVRTVRSSRYLPLQRHAHTMVAYKRGQAADGCDSLHEVVQKRQCDPGLVAERVGAWRALARRHGELVVSAQREHRWPALGLADPFDLDGALAQVDARLDRYLEDRR